MSNSRVWIFRALVVACALLILVSWSMPWWTADIAEISPQAVQIRPWGLENNVGAEYGPLIKKAAMPDWFAPFMWSFLAIMLICLALSLVVKDNLVSLGKLNFIVPKWLRPLGLPSWLIGGVGVAYCVCVAVMFIYASQQTPNYWHTPFLGTTHISLGDSYNSDVTTSLQPGYFLAWVVGLVLIVTGLNRHKLLGIPLPTKATKAAK
jgi:hypothetical protein